MPLNSASLFFTVVIALSSFCLIRLHLQTHSVAITAIHSFRHHGVCSLSVTYVSFYVCFMLVCVSVRPTIRPSETDKEGVIYYENYWLGGSLWLGG